MGDHYYGVGVVGRAGDWMVEVGCELEVSGEEGYVLGELIFGMMC